LSSAGGGEECGFVGVGGEDDGVDVRRRLVGGADRDACDVRARWAVVEYCDEVQFAGGGPAFGEEAFGVSPGAEEGDAVEALVEEASFDVAPEAFAVPVGAFGLSAEFGVDDAFGAGGFEVGEGFEERGGVGVGSCGVVEAVEPFVDGGTEAVGGDGFAAVEHVACGGVGFAVEAVGGEVVHAIGGTGVGDGGPAGEGEPVAGVVP